MRISLVISSLSSGGAERVLSNLANYWDAKGHPITIVTLATDAPFYPLSQSIKLDQIDQVTAEGTCFSRRMFQLLKRVYFLRKAIVRSKPDVVLSFVDVMNITTLIACVGLKTPVIVSERINPFFHCIPSFYKLLRMYFYRRAKKVVVQTKSAAAYFETLKNIDIIPNAVQKSYALTRDFSKPIACITSVGRLCEQKGFSILIQAFAEVSKSHPHLILTIYGEGLERSNLELLIKSQGLTDRVFLPGAVADIGKALADTDLFVFPSRYEGFPNALCEAMAAGLAVIASNCTGNVDVIRDGIDGRLFPVDDVNALVLLMKELIADSEQRQRLAESAITLSDRYSANRINHLWDSVIDEKSSSL